MFSLKAYDLTSNKFLVQLTVPIMGSVSGVGFKSNQKWLATPIDIYAYSIQVGLFPQNSHYSSSRSSQLGNTIDYFSTLVAHTKLPSTV